MAPTRQCRSVNKRYLYNNEISPSNDVASTNKKNQRHDESDVAGGCFVDDYDIEGSMEADTTELSRDKNENSAFDALETLANLSSMISPEANENDMPAKCQKEKHSRKQSISRSEAADDKPQISAKNLVDDKHAASEAKNLHQFLAKVSKKRQKISGSKIMANLGWNPKHNICAYLNPLTKNAQSYAEIIAFLQRSRIHHAISARHSAYKSHQLLFWRSAVLDEDADPLIIKGNILDREVSISVDDIRRVLRFGEEPEGVIQLNKHLVRGCFLRMKYNGDINEGNLSKAHICPQFKYLMHVIMHCLGSRKGGFDNIREILQSAMVALVLNRPYNFSAMIFHHLVENVSKKGTKKFLMYPRFLQMIFDDKLPNLPKAEADKIMFEHMTDTTLNRLNTYRGNDDKPPVRRLFGHLSRIDYIAPPNKRWRNDNSDSDVEDIVIPEDDDHDDDQDDDNGQGGNIVAHNVDQPQQQPQEAQTEPEERQEQPASQTEQQHERVELVVTEPVEDELKEAESDTEFEHVVEGSRLITRKRRHESLQSGSSRIRDGDIKDADFIPDFSDVHVDDIPVPTSPPKKSKAESSKGKGKEKQRKRRQFEIVRRNTVTPQIQPQVFQAITSAATPSVSVPISTAAATPTKSIAESSMGKGKEKQRKRRRFVIVRRNPVTPQIQPQVSQAMTSVATPSVSVPMSTAAATPKKSTAETSKGKDKEKLRKRRRFVIVRRNPVTSQIQPHVSQAMTSAVTPSVSVPMSTAAATPKKKSRAESSKGKDKEKQRKRKRFVIERRNPVTPQIERQVSQAMTSAAAPSVSVPMSTAAVQTTVSLSQAFARLNEAFSGPSLMSVTPTTSPIVTGLQTPVTITFSPLPANLDGESSLISNYPLQEQINKLNSSVKMLLDKCLENEKQIASLTESNKQLQLTVVESSGKINKLEEESIKLKTTVDELSKNPRT